MWCHFGHPVFGIDRRPITWGQTDVEEEEEEEESAVGVSLPSLPSFLGPRWRLRDEVFSGWVSSFPPPFSNLQPEKRN